MPWLYKTPAHGPASSFFGLAAQSRGGSAAGLLLTPALGERCHRSPACLSIAVRSALDVPAVPARPHPGAALRRDRHLENPPTTTPFSNTVVVILVVANRRALEDQRFSHPPVIA